MIGMSHPLFRKDFSFSPDCIRSESSNGSFCIERFQSDWSFTPGVCVHVNVAIDSTGHCGHISLFSTPALDPLVRVLDPFTNYMVCKLCDSVFCHVGLISEALRRLPNLSLKSMHVE